MAYAPERQAPALIALAAASRAANTDARIAPAEPPSPFGTLAHSPFLDAELALK